MAYDKGPPRKDRSLGGFRKIKKGTDAARVRLNELEFDPIERLVEQYQNIEWELIRQEKIREGVVVELKADGKPRAYNADRHLALYDKLTAIGDKLLRYGYARIPETSVVDTTTPQGLTINLTGEGQTFTIGGPTGEENGE